MIAVGDAASMPISARPRSRGTAARHGVRDVAPMLVGLVPFGLVVGVAVAASGPVAARWSATFLVFAGSAQLVVLDLLDHGAPVALVVAAGLAANARLIAYSASLAPRWSGEPRWFRLIGAAALVDPTWALAQRDLDRGRRGQPPVVLRRRRRHPDRRMGSPGHHRCLGWKQGGRGGRQRRCAGCGRAPLHDRGRRTATGPPDCRRGGRHRSSRRHSDRSVACRQRDAGSHRCGHGRRRAHPRSHHRDGPVPCDGRPLAGRTRWRRPTAGWTTAGWTTAGIQARRAATRSAGGAPTRGGAMTSATTTWFAVLAVGAGSYLFRSVPLLLRQVRPADARTARLMSHAGLASIAARWPGACAVTPRWRVAGQDSPRSPP